jgi:hypothetical protein
MIWKDDSGFAYFYSGEFNADGKFHGKGRLLLIQERSLTREEYTKAILRMD